MTGSILVTLSHEVVDVLLTNWELQVVAKHTFDLIDCDIVPLSLVKQSECPSRLFVLSTSVPSVAYHKLDSVKVDASPAKELRISLLKLIVNFFLAHAVETKVV